MDAFHKQKAAQYKKTAEVSIHQRAKMGGLGPRFCTLDHLREVYMF